MTATEQKQYNDLTPRQRDEYNLKKKYHPNWNHKDIMTSVGMEISKDDMLAGGGTVDVTGLTKNPSFLKKVYEGTLRFLEKNGVYFEDVINALKSSISRLGDLIWQGVTYISEQVDDFLDWIFD